MSQEPLELGDLTGPAGRVERAAARSIQAAREAQVLEPTDDGMAALVVELGRAVDVASQARNVRGVALVAKELRETAARLRLDPTARGEAAGDAFNDLLQTLREPSGPTVGHSTEP